MNSCATRWILSLAGVATAAGVTIGTLRRGEHAATQPALLGSESSCAAYTGLPPTWGQDFHAGMVWITGGRVTLGSVDGYPEERPEHVVEVADFWIDRTEVTNAQYATFVQASGYVTEAERRGAGVVFRMPREGQVQREGSWWHEVPGANWRQPEGHGSDLHGREHHPVVQLTRADAQSYAQWLGRALPTEAQWEYAAKAHGQSERIERGPRDAQGRPSANFWQGMFPYLDVGEDGHIGRSPVGCYAANGFGLHDMIGNVWEWTSESWAGAGPGQAHGAGLATTAAQPGRLGLIKGGSFLCSTDYCVRYRASARHPHELAVPTVHIGFRTVLSR